MFFSIYLRTVLGLIDITAVTVIAVENEEFDGLAFEDSLKATECALAELVVSF